MLDPLLAWLLHLIQETAVLSKLCGAIPVRMLMSWCPCKAFRSWSHKRVCPCQSVNLHPAWYFALPGLKPLWSTPNYLPLVPADICCFDEWAVYFYNRNYVSLLGLCWDLTLSYWFRDKEMMWQQIPKRTRTTLLGTYLMWGLCRVSRRGEAALL